MASYEDLRASIVAVLEAELSDVSLYPTVVDRANLPAIVVQPRPAEFPMEVGSGTDRWNFDLVLMVPYTDAVISQKRLDTYLSGSGPTSIRQIFMRHRRLDRDDVMAAYIAGMSDYGNSFNMAAVDNLGCRLQMVVLTSAPAWD